MVLVLTLCVGMFSTTQRSPTIFMLIGSISSHRAGARPGYQIAWQREASTSPPGNELDLGLALSLSLLSWNMSFVNWSANDSVHNQWSLGSCQPYFVSAQLIYYLFTVHNCLIERGIWMFSLDSFWWTVTQSENEWCNRINEITFAINGMFFTVKFSDDNLSDVQEI